MNEITYDYGTSFRGIVHTREFFLTLQTDYVSGADVLDAQISGKSVTITGGPDSPYQIEIRYIPSWYGYPVDGYLPSSGQIYTVDFDSGYGFRLPITAQEFPDINDYINNQYTSKAGLLAAFDAYHDAAELWYSDLDQTPISEADFGTADGVLGQFSSKDPLIPISFLGRIEAVFDLDSTVIGSDFRDEITTYDGDDNLSGGLEDDALVGGKGSDTFAGIGAFSNDPERGKNEIDGTDFLDRSTTDTVVYDYAPGLYSRIWYDPDAADSHSMVVNVRNNVGDQDIIRNWDRLVFKNAGKDVIVTHDQALEKGMFAFFVWGFEHAFFTIREFIGEPDDPGLDPKFGRILIWYEFAEDIVSSLSTALVVNDEFEGGLRTFLALIAAKATDPFISDARDKLVDIVGGKGLPPQMEQDAIESIESAAADLRTLAAATASSVAGQVYDSIEENRPINWTALWTSFMNEISTGARELYKEESPAFDDPNDQFDDPQIQPDIEQAPEIIMRDLSTIDGTSGDDALVGNDLGQIFAAGSGDDFVFGAGGDDLLIAGSGEGDDYYDGGSGSDTIIFASSSAGVFVDLRNGNAVGPETGSDRLASIESVVGGGGVDTLIGGLGGDTLDGGLHVGAAPAGWANELYGGAGDDTYHIRNSLDMIDEGGYRPDLGAGGTDTVISHANWFWDHANVGEKLIIAEDAADASGAGTTLVATVFDNEIIGNSKTNILFGRGGSDTYRAGDGIDFISLSLLGVPEDYYPGVDGVNTIVVEAREDGTMSYDIVFEFESGKDKLDVSDYGYASAAEVFARGVDAGDNSYFALGDGFDYLYMIGLNLSELSAGDFVV